MDPYMTAGSWAEGGENMALLARDVANNPRRYDGKLVSVIGRVTNIWSSEIELEAGLDCHMSHYEDCHSVERGQKIVVAGKVRVNSDGKASIKNGSVVKKFPFRG